jgi:hypothetical protein
LRSFGDRNCDNFLRISHGFRLCCGHSSHYHMCLFNLTFSKETLFGVIRTHTSTRSSYFSTGNHDETNIALRSSRHYSSAYECLRWPIRGSDGFLPSDVAAWVTVAAQGRMSHGVVLLVLAVWIRAPGENVDLTPKLAKRIRHDSLEVSRSRCDVERLDGILAADFLRCCIDAKSGPDTSLLSTVDLFAVRFGGEMRSQAQIVQRFGVELGFQT